MIRLPHPVFAPDDAAAAPAAPAASAPAPATPPADSAKSPDSPPREERREEPRNPEADLDAQLAAIWDESHDPARPDTKKTLDELAADERERDARGRFVGRKPADGAPPAKLDGQENSPDDNNTDQSNDGEDGHQSAKAPAATVPMPQSWSREEEAIWSQLTPEAQQRIAARETETSQQFSRLGRELKAFREYEPVNRAVAPYKGYLVEVGRQLGMSPANLIQQTLSFEHTLRTGSPDQKIEVLRDIISAYGIDVSSVFGEDIASNLTSERDPRFDNLVQRLQGVESHLSQEAAQRQHAQDAAIQRQIAEFSKDRPHFAAVRKAMGILMQNEMAQTMEEAYDMAVHANPSIRRLVLEQQRKDAEAERLRKLQSRVHEAKADADINVRSGTPAPANRSMEDTINSVADRIYGRGR